MRVAAGRENNAAAVNLATVWSNPTGKSALFTADSQGFVKLAN